MFNIYTNETQKKLPQKYVLKGALLVTQNKFREVYRGDILVEQGRIALVGKNIHESELEFDCSNYVICPGFINTHIHLGETIFRGQSDGMTLDQYLHFTESLWKKNPEHREYGRNIISKVTLMESLKWGTTTLCSIRGWESLSESNLNFYFGYPLMASNKLKGYLKNWRTQYKSIHQTISSQRIKLGIFAHSIQMIDHKILSELASFIMNSEVFFSLFISQKPKHKFKTLSDNGRCQKLRY